MPSGKNPVTVILAATHPALGIGKNGSLPWRLKREMKFFKQVTEGSTVVMGRRTWESIPPKFRPLSNRTNIVISTNRAAQYDEGVLAATSVEQALEAAGSAKPIYIIGGAQIYAESLPFADRILLTLIEDPENRIECDTFFKFDQNLWHQKPATRLTELFSNKVELPADLNAYIEENGYKYRFTVWEKQ